MHQACIFCDIATGATAADIVYKSAELIAFLDIHPLFPGHVLVCPRSHYETLLDVPRSFCGPLMEGVQLLGRAVENAVDAEGTFIAINNRVSQTVAHLHIHVVPRRRKDGLRGFFWPRQRYKDDQAKEALRLAIETEVRKLA
jgi:histidine triad (HIT) family protein